MLLNRVCIHHPMQIGVSNSPLLLPAEQGDSLVVETNDTTTALLLIAINEPNCITDGHLVATQTLSRLFTNLHISAIQIDRSIGNQPASAIFLIQNNGLFSAKFKDFSTTQGIGLSIEILALCEIEWVIEFHFSA